MTLAVICLLCGLWSKIKMLVDKCLALLINFVYCLCMKTVAVKKWLLGLAGCVVLTIGMVAPIAPKLVSAAFPGGCIPPTTFINNPPGSKAPVTGPVDINVTVTDPGGIERIQFILSGPGGYSWTPVPTWNYTAPYPTSVTVDQVWDAAVPPGFYNLNVSAQSPGPGGGSCGSGFSDILNRLPTHTYPYLKTYGGDVEAGGGFDTSGGSCVGGSPDLYQYPLNNSESGKDPLNGGITAFAKTGGNKGGGGSSSQYAAFAAGSIDATKGTAGAPDSGFYSKGIVAGSQINTLDFASFAGPSSSGGNFVGASENAEMCIPDYYDQEYPDAVKNTKTTGWTYYSGTAPNGCEQNGVYYIDATILPNSTFNLNNVASGGADRTVCLSANITVVVKGNVYIGSNILYPGGRDVTNTPKFAVIALGDIYIDHSVSQINGWYIAQPSPGSALSADSGVIWTCHDNTNEVHLSTLFLENSCKTTLTVNGALTAKHVNFFRSNGDVVTQADNSGDGPGVYNDAHAAEIINYTPDMVVGGPFFNKSSSAGGSTGSPVIENLVNLPPIF